MPPQESKYQQVYDCLMQRIRDGQYVPDKRLPSERDLAREQMVNVATVRRAFKELLQQGYVEKRVGDGTYLLQSTPEQPVLHIITSAYEGAVSREFVSEAVTQAMARGYQPQVQRLRKEDGALELSRLNRRQKWLVLMDEALLKKPVVKILQQVGHNAVIVGCRLDGEGIASVVGDDDTGMRLLYDHLQQLGHRDIAIVCNNLQHPIERRQVAIGKSLSERTVVINAAVAQTGLPMDAAYSAVKDALVREAFTALICLNDELAVGALAACRESGRELSTELSLCSVGNTCLSRYSYPSLTSIDPGLQGHIEKALDALDAPTLDAVDLLQIVRPLLVERESSGKVSPALMA